MKTIAFVALAACSSDSPKVSSPTKDMWAAGEAYERYMGRWSRLVAPELVDFAGVHDGDHVLDLGSGTGALAYAMAERGARVIGVDPSATYVGFASRGATDRVRFQVGDAQRLELGGAAFDKTVSLLVVNFIPDRERALAEMKRVTKPGGVVAAAVWDYADGMQMLRVFWDEAVALDPAIAPRDEANMPLCKRGELAAFWRANGLENVEERPIIVTMRFTSFEDYWEPFLLGQGPAGAYVAQLPTDQRDALQRRLRARLPAEGNFELTARVWAVKGVVP